MFCPACGVENVDSARFCNQCGVRIESMAPVASPPTGHGASGAASGAPPADRVTAAGATSPRRASLSGQSSARLDLGLSTGDAIELPMTGPSKRTLLAMFLGVGLGCAALGALVAVRAFRGNTPEGEPVTPVGLIGQPAPVEPVDAGPVERGGPAPVEPSGRPVGNPPRAPNGAALAQAPRAAAPAAQRPTAANGNPATPTAANGNPATPTAANNNPATPASPDPGQAAPAAAANTNTAANGAAPAPSGPDENGVTERGPRTSRGGYAMGDETDATGRMDPQAFTYVYRHYSPQISSCYSSASRNREVNGVVVMRVRIGEDGRVRRTRVMSDTVRVPELVTCLQNQVATWRYPQPEGGEVEVDYPMRFGSAR
ncbi:MAG: AgmX/PglI C-terminal domain-containing protein [Myxococcales bacterium]|nr:AgmX/PglI C-terminal domain-containing protein [Myxococcales bacterium]